MLFYLMTIPPEETLSLMEAWNIADICNWWYKQMLRNSSYRVVPHSALSPVEINTRGKCYILLPLLFVSNQLLCAASLTGRRSWLLREGWMGALLTPFIGQSNWAVIAGVSGDPEDTVGNRPPVREGGADDSSVYVGGGGRSLWVVTLSNVCAGSLSLLLESKQHMHIYWKCKVTIKPCFHS